MNTSADPLLRRPYVTVFESELRVMAGLSAAWGTMETGGMAFGLLSRGGRPVIHLVTAPGPKAVHQYAHFEQDLEFAKATIRTIEQAYGSQYNGDWHSHHVLGLDEASAGDVDQVRSVTSHNGFQRWCGFITTAAGNGNDLAANLRFGWNQAAAPAAAGSCVRVNACVYADPQAGRKVQAPLRVLAGVSPLRVALLANAVVDPARLGQHAASFPLERIVYDVFETDQAPSASADEIPKEIVAQLEKLPKDVQNANICLDVDANSVVVHLPLGGGRVADVAYDRRTPHCPQTVHVRHTATGQRQDVTARVPVRGRRARLHRIYDLLAHPSCDVPSLSGLKRGSPDTTQPPKPIAGPARNRPRTVPKTYGGDMHDVEQRATGTPGV